MELVKGLNELSGRDDGKFAFAGVLSDQVYVSHRKEVLAYASIHCHKSTVMVYTNNVIIRDNRIWKVYELESDPYGGFVTKSLAGRQTNTGSLPGYASQVLEMMEVKSPKEVEWRENASAEAKTIREYMGLPEKQD